jgi:hypothetical protein
MRVLLLGALISFAGCAATAPARAPVEVGQEFTLARGESVAIGQQGASVAFKDVIEDSRCPMNARCIWEGNARIAVELSRSRAGRAADSHSLAGGRVELNTSSRFHTSEIVSGLVIELRRLEPERIAGAQTQGYVATLLVGAP